MENNEKLVMLDQEVIRETVIENDVPREIVPIQGRYDVSKSVESKEPICEFKKFNDSVMILGFAPDSLKWAPLDANGVDIWALNELYLDRPKIALRATAWFQLHGYEPPTIRDPQQVRNLALLKCPVLMWRKHPNIPNAIEYPLQEVLEEFDIYGEDMALDQPDVRQRSYFTNTISWMIALAIRMGYKDIQVYGVNMAQDQEFQHQRPSCEFFLGWARGKGIKIYKPPVSDLLLSPFLYGYDDATAYIQKLEARRTELIERVENTRRQRIGMQEQANQQLQAEQNLLGALHDVEYIMRLGNPAKLDNYSKPKGRSQK
jgi:hypothetical protein